MYHAVTTLTEHILREERKFQGATGSFTLLLTLIENASKIIASHLRRTGLVDILGQTGVKNTYGDEVQKLDAYSDRLLRDTLIDSGQVYAVASEETEKPYLVKTNAGHYSVFFDPLDGSSNIDVSGSIGTIFSVYRKADTLLQSGKQQVAAGYILYGPSTLFVYSCGNGVHGFTLDPSIGSYLLSHPDMRIPENGKTYAVNEGNYPALSEKDREYLDSLKHGQTKHTLRYTGAMVADVHRILCKGGIFLYPADSKNVNGKLRLMYEVNPMAYLVQQAGGKAVSNGINPLDMKPSEFTQRVPIVLGSKNEVSRYIDMTGS